MALGAKVNPSLSRDGADWPNRTKSRRKMASGIGQNRARPHQRPHTPRNGKPGTNIAGHGSMAQIGAWAVWRCVHQGHGPRATGHGPRATGHGPRATGCAWIHFLASPNMRPPRNFWMRALSKFQRKKKKRKICAKPLNTGAVCETLGACSGQSLNTPPNNQR